MKRLQMKERTKVEVEVLLPDLCISLFVVCEIFPFIVTANDLSFRYSKRSLFLLTEICFCFKNRSKHFP